ncbi:hypothetical protein R1sor_016003 [Riccia sorocarpa]|uniref:Uncharacterized protein n=1 Tax=Riccia sorocarpa TaxID=122646 RepID=A0ABD3HHS3_9MARC
MGKENQEAQSRQEQQGGERTRGKPGYATARDDGFQRVANMRSRKGKWVPRAGILDKGYYKVCNAYDLLNKEDEVEQDDEEAIGEDAKAAQDKDEETDTQEESESDDATGASQDKEMEESDEEGTGDPMDKSNAPGNEGQNLQRIDEGSHEGREEDTDNRAEGNGEGRIGNTGEVVGGSHEHSDKRKTPDGKDLGKTGIASSSRNIATGVGKGSSKASKNRKEENKKVRKVMISATKGRRVQDSRLDRVQEQVEVYRKRVATDNCPQNQKGLQEALNNLRRIENKEADIWKTRSRTKWAREGDAPTRYYFALTRARFKRETITKLEAEDGRTMESQKEIVQHEENLEMEVEPDLNEVEQTSEGMQKEKALGLDGVTVAVVINLWDEIKEDWSSWTGTTSCSIAEAGESFVYLGVRTGHKLDEKEVVEDIIKKLMKRITHWSTRQLTQPGKVVLLKHILAALPTYQMMTIGINDQGFQKLESQCRQFVCGWNSTGKPKTSLIAWWKLALRKEDVGMN